MSEFRKQRLLAKLFDSFSYQRNACDFVSSLGFEQPSATYKIDEDLVNRLATTSADPERFSTIAHSLMIKQNTDVTGVLHIIDRLKRLNQSKANATSAIAQPSSFHHLEPLDTEFDSANSQVKETDLELDEISRKLTSIHNRTGASIDFGGLPTMSTGSSKLKISTFKNKFESALSSRPAETRELYVVEDLLFVLMGSRGSFIVPEEDGFSVDDTMPGESIPLIIPFLELSKHMSFLRKFAVSTRASAFGPCLQAFGAALEEFCLEFGQLIAALERRFNSTGFLLSQLRFYLRAYFESAPLLAGLLEEVLQQRLDGGALLKHLEVKLACNSGNRTFQSLIDRFLIPTAQPFLDGLVHWLSLGELKDGNRANFMIGVNALKGSELDAYELRPEAIPCALAGCAQKVLLIGVYQSILRQSNAPGASLCVIGDSLSSYSQVLLTRSVNALFVEVNRAMLQLLEQQGGILNLFARLKTVFFADRSDILLDFMKRCKDELSCPVGDVDPVWLNRRLETLYEESGEDANSVQSIQCSLTGETVFDQLLGIIGGKAKTSESMSTLKIADVLVLQYSIPFPMSLVVGREALSKYQIIFRLRLALLRLSLRLSCKLQTGWNRSFLLLRHTVVHFFNVLQSFLALHVLEPRYASLLKSLSTASGLDDIIAAHTDYLDTCLRECLLTNSKLVQLLGSLFSIANGLCSIMEGSAGQVEELEAQFSQTLRVFLEALRYYSARDSDHHLGALLTLLDFNSFYYAPAGTSTPAVCL